MCKSFYTHIVLFVLVANVRADWDSEFIEDSHTIPSIEVKLSPPENPLPQVQEEIDKLEKHRIRLEEGMQAKLQDVFNETLVESRDKIAKIINDALSIFEQENLLKNIALISRKKRASVKFVNLLLYKARHLSLLQLNEKIIPSSVRVMMTESQPPDPVIKEKMDQIEQVRNDEEIQIFHQQSQELGQLSQVTFIELGKALQLQLNPYLMDESNLKRRTPGQGNAKAPVFFQLASGMVPNAKQLNVKIGQSETPYPTVEDLVMNMEKRRDAAEQAQRTEALQMYLKLVKAQHEMIREQLHVTTAKILAEYSALEHNITNASL
ncbi:hypothetical protein BdWA1_000406 [Babesia duncani]|uniref:Blood stage antigen 41-3 n=1 Tax=Babesia duncani TaxID=323732 RepID=A0AAD9PMS0_9APIC|nr:hypothetical protein BdWA1_000406 [Babesia duncani]